MTSVRRDDELRLVRGRWAAAAAALLAVVYLAAPFVVSDFWLSVLDYAGIAAVGAIGLNLLTGSTGQISIGHAALVGLGAYVTAVLGGDLGLPLPLWLVGAGLAGGLVGAVIGPFALRLRGDYLVIVTLGLVFFAEHVYTNWEGLTGGPTGRAVEAPASLGFDFDALSVVGTDLTRNASWFWLIWAVVALSALAVKNILRSRPGRALQAVRDREAAAEVIGISLARYKIGAFVISSALAAIAGALYGAFQLYVAPTEWNLFLSVQYVAIIIVGGMGSVFGAIVGALFVGSLPRVIEEYSGSLPGVATDAGAEGVITVFALNQVLFGALIVAFLVFEPRGLAAIWERIKAYVRPPVGGGRS